MASRTTAPCPHELRPGTTVCLRCQHAERAAARAKQRRVLARGFATTVTLVMVVALGIAAASALRARAGASPTSATGAVADSGTAGNAVVPDSTSESSADTASREPELPTPAFRPEPVALTTPPPAAASPATMIGSAPTAATPKLVSPVVPMGRSALRDTMVADRAGDTVRVSFDLSMSRTRRPEKFEAIMRSTLPQVYGSAVDSALRALPVGAVERAGDLVTTLPVRGFKIPISPAHAIAVWPETRAGRDGPLVIAYRAVLSGSR